MSIRVSIVTTRTGDDGTTGLGDKSRVLKSAPRIHALGEVDELNSVIGLWRSQPLPEAIDRLLARIQNELFDLGGELSIPGWTALREEQVLALEEATRQANEGLGALQEFILPGGCPAAAAAHLARSVARRAERAVVALAQEETINPPVRQYLNRLSDLCFVLARQLNHQAGEPDVLWSREP
ncbi:cob(I)yrinic acid a,c-diamide adenosyltransferase [Castellaniella sp.]|uniref:cob(I)yrinic acid a,c-diamide adenosyltransferase n=1 Tax=Castellaniella sp. TaxID=1955812 RepID=UPI00355F5D16